jgi:tetratricopeptide (TPR) repeat protein
LEQAGNFRAALELLNLLMKEWPDDAQRAAVFHQRAECLEKLGDNEAAIKAYRSVFDAQRSMPSYRTTAHLGFGLLAALSPYPDLYDEALSVLDEFASSSTFPVEDFKAAAIRALIADAKGEEAEASRQAQRALAAAEKRHSGYARHAALGLVTGIEPSLDGRLKQLASPGAD